MGLWNRWCTSGAAILNAMLSVCVVIGVALYYHKLKLMIRAVACVAVCGLSMALRGSYNLRRSGSNPGLIHRT